MSVEIQFVSESDSLSSRAHQDLCSHLKTEGVEAEVSGQDGKMDFAAIITIVLASPFVAIIAKGIVDRIMKFGLYEVEFTFGDKKVTVKNVRKKSAVELIKEIKDVLTQNE